MRFAGTLTIACSIFVAAASHESDAQVRTLKQRIEEERLARSPRGDRRRQRMHESRRLALEQDVHIHPDYDKRRKAYDVGSGIFFPQDSTSKPAEIGTSEDMQFWGRLLQIDSDISMSIAPSPSPLASPIASPSGSLATPTMMPQNDPATDSPILSPTPLPTRFPTSMPQGVSMTVPPTLLPTSTPQEGSPTVRPTRLPTSTPQEGSPTVRPTPMPQVVSTTSAPTRRPTFMPTSSPSAAPTQSPSRNPTPAPTPSRVEQIVLSVALLGGAEFLDTNSYQSRALSWLDRFSDTSGLSDARIIQRYSLACIFYATNAVRTVFTDMAFDSSQPLPQWQNRENWLTDTNECNWYAIEQCDSSNMVVELDLFSNLLTGEFPPEIVLLKASIEVLDLGRNLFFTEGVNFNTVLGQLTKLKFLLFDQTNMINLNGIPTEIGNLKSLESFNCVATRYGGALNGDAFQPDQINWTILEIEENAFNSAIPSAIANLPALEQFFGRDCGLQGTLEPLRNMDNAVVLWVDMNPLLGGPIPTEFGNFQQLRSLSLTECDFTGTFPSELGTVSSLSQLFLFRNRLDGTIPSELAELQDLSILEIWENNFTGIIPPLVCQLTFSDLTRLIADCENCPTAGFCCDSCVG